MSKFKSPRRNLKLRDAEFEALDTETRRSMIYQLMFIDTPKYQYCIGTKNNRWTIVRYEWAYGDEVNKETATIVDEWNHSSWIV